nr:MAG TPA: hypothetical protein [Bacteriophage sp.]
MLLFEKNLLEGVRLRPGDLLHRTPPRGDY